MKTPYLGVHQTGSRPEFISNREIELTRFFQLSQFSLSVPRVTPDGERAVEIATHSELESARLGRLAPYRFVAKTDISRFYHSIYTHSIPWAFHGKAASKADRRANSANLFMNRLDLILRAGQDGQTIGIPVGPDASRYIAEVICTAIVWMSELIGMVLSAVNVITAKLLRLPFRKALAEHPFGEQRTQVP
ncbi:RNA-directed DNA polymerase, partial [Sphingobium cupriresistens]|uniref:RNA-directed DNA polymerase n=1 Tax=Sphingobium cupriresistens TaxID=1132417 RepID=UPI0013EA5A69